MARVPIGNRLAQVWDTYSETPYRLTAPSVPPNAINRMRSTKAPHAYERTGRWPESNRTFQYETTSHKKGILMAPTNFPRKICKKTVET